MMDIKINGRAFKYQNTSDIVNVQKGMPVYVYGDYSDDLLDKLYALQVSDVPVHALVLFKPEVTHQLLRHLNIFDSFTFTLIPTEISIEVYEEIYRFFLFSPLSTTYFTWISKLMLKPVESDIKININGCEPHYNPCPADCPLKARNCSKELLLTELYHPLKLLPAQLPLEDDLLTFCIIHREFSERIVRDLQKKSGDIDKFQKVKESAGVFNRYWIDPQMIFAKSGNGGSKPKTTTDNVEAWLSPLVHKFIPPHSLGFTTRYLEKAPETPTVEIAFTAGDADTSALIIDGYRPDFYECIPNMLTRESKLPGILRSYPLHMIDKYIKKTGIIQNYSCIKLDLINAPSALKRISTYNNFSENLKSFDEFLQKINHIGLYSLRDYTRIFAINDCVSGNLINSGYTMKFGIEDDITVLRIWTNTALSIAMQCADRVLERDVNENFIRLVQTVNGVMGGRIKNVVLGTDIMTSNVSGREMEFSIDVPDITGAELVEVISNLMPGHIDFETERIKAIGGKRWMDLNYDYLKIRPLRFDGGVAFKYCLSTDNFFWKERACV